MQTLHHIKNYLLIFILAGIAAISKAQQADSAVQQLQQFPAQYFTKIDHKIDKYQTRLSHKTKKTLAKLSRWENKIQHLLQKVNPQAAEQLFGNGQTTFATVLQKIKEGQSIAQNSRAQYDAYRDKLSSSLAYLAQQKNQLGEKLAQPLQNSTQKLDGLETTIQNSEALEEFIKQRRKQLIDQSLQYIGKSKYLQKIDKESYYYIETLKNYKALFSDTKKAEELGLKILNKIPAFTKFIQQNSQLATLFSIPGTPLESQSFAGLQTRASLNSLLQDKIASGGPNAQQQLTQHLQQAQEQMQQIQKKLLQSGQTSTTEEMWSKGAPNQQKTKTFKQRLEFGSNFQFGKTTRLLPATADMGLSIGYKLNDKSIIGLGASYKMGMGSLERIRITHQGLGLRSFVDWKLPSPKGKPGRQVRPGGGFYISGGYEMNYQAQIKNIAQLSNYESWQPSGLIGISKKIAVKTRWIKETKLQLLYDMLYRTHVPVKQPVVFRMGYGF